MSSKHFMPFYVGDYLSKTMHLNTMQHGMYVLLICHYWEHGCVPKTGTGRARVARVPYSTWRDHEETIAAFFSHPGWYHERIDTELARYEEIKETRRLAGSLGGNKAKINRHLRIAKAIANTAPQYDGNPRHSVALAVLSTKTDIERKKEVGEEEREEREPYDWREAARALSQPGKRRE